MSTQAIPDEVRALIEQHISSVAQLEVLLLFFRTSPRTWDAAEVARELRIDAGSAGGLVTDLSARGFLGPDQAAPGRHRYAPSSPSLSSAVPALETCYRERRVAVITQIFAKPPEPLRQFAEAFRLKKKDD
jgi:hypothetical protein